MCLQLRDLPAGSRPAEQWNPNCTKGSRGGRDKNALVYSRVFDHRDHRRYSRIWRAGSDRGDNRQDLLRDIHHPVSDRAGDRPAASALSPDFAREDSCANGAFM